MPTYRRTTLSPVSLDGLNREFDLALREIAAAEDAVITAAERAEKLGRIGGSTDDELRERYEIDKFPYMEPARPGAADDPMFGVPEASGPVEFGPSTNHDEEV